MQWHSAQDQQISWNSGKTLVPAPSLLASCPALTLITVKITLKCPAPPSPHWMCPQSRAPGGSLRWCCHAARRCSPANTEGSGRTGISSPDSGACGVEASCSNSVMPFPQHHWPCASSRQHARQCRQHPDPRCLHVPKAMCTTASPMFVLQPTPHIPHIMVHQAAQSSSSTLHKLTCTTVGGPPGALGQSSQPSTSCC